MPVMHIAPDIGYLFNPEIAFTLCNKRVSDILAEGDFIGIANNLNLSLESCKGVHKMPRKYEHKREPLTLDDCNKLSNACETMQEKLVVWTLLDSGLRVEEFCNMKKENIDWQRHMITVYGKNTLGGDKKRRTVNMTPRVKPLLEAWISANDKIGFTTKTAWATVKRVANKAKISQKCSPHVLRHSFAINSLEKGISLPSLQKAMGHERLETTAIYLRKSNAESVREYKEKW
jgi:integrase/recombinase XerD